MTTRFMQEQIILQAPAKVNLFLDIRGKRPDGFHELDSLVMPVSLFDTLCFERTTDGACSLTCTAEGVDVSAMGEPESNLVLRAARLLQEVSGTVFGARIGLTKRIPLGGGLGGGSSDCAAALKGLNALWGLGLAQEVLEELGSRLGSDVPAFMRGGAVRMRGRGELVEGAFEELPAAEGGESKPVWLVLANCGVHCPTKEIYGGFTQGLTVPPDFYYTVASLVRGGLAPELARYLHNGLENAAFALYPAVGACAEVLRRAGALGVLLCGSGATVFGLVRDKAHGESVCKGLPTEWWKVCVHSCPMV